MKISKIGRIKNEDSYGKVTLSNYAVADIEGTVDEIKAFEDFIVLRGFEAPAVEAEVVCFRGERATPIVAVVYSFDPMEATDFKEGYKTFKKGL